jgi:hypothetical protein
MIGDGRFGNGDVRIELIGLGFGGVDLERIHIFSKETFPNVLLFLFGSTYGSVEERLE